MTATDYTCESCRASGKDDDRICFRYQDYEEKSLEVRWPSYNDDGKLLPVWEWDTADISNMEEMLELIVAIAEFDTVSPTWEILMNRYIRVVKGNKDVNMEVCPIAFLDELAMTLVGSEALCARYSMAPKFPPTLDAQDPVIMTAFAVIASTKAEYELLKAERNKKS